MMLPDDAAFDLAIANGVVVLIMALGMLLYLVRLTVKFTTSESENLTVGPHSRPGIGREKDGSSSSGNSISTTVELRS
jgi:hypothetical protein